MNDTSYRNQKLNELNGLIDLAEKTSEKFQHFQYILSKIKISILICYLFIAFFLITIIYIFMYYEVPRNYQGIIGIISFLCLSLLFLYIFFKIKQLNKLKDEIESERKILFELLNMISGIKESVFMMIEISFVERAIIEMRLSRISFSTKTNHFLF